MHLTARNGSRTDLLFGNITCTTVFSRKCYFYNPLIVDRIYRQFYKHYLKSLRLSYQWERLYSDSAEPFINHFHRTGNSKNCTAF